MKMNGYSLPAQVSSVKKNSFAKMRAPVLAWRHTAATSLSHFSETVKLLEATRQRWWLP